MTNSEAVQILKQYIDMDSEVKSEYLEVQRMAIKALEQTDTLDRIITQIEQTRDKDKLCEYPYNRCIRIIEEYKEK